MIILKIFALILILAGVKLIYDARLISIDVFSFGDQNEATLGLKMCGVIIYVIGMLILYII